MLQTQFTTKIFAALALSSVASATAGTPGGLITARADEAASLKVYGPSGKPEIAALEAAIPAAFGHKNAPGVKDWLPILLGFHKCNKAWAPSMFKQDGDTPADGEAYVKVYKPEDQTRDEQLIKLDSMERSGKMVPDFDWEGQKDKAWWPWALLEASQKYTLEDSKLDFAQSVRVLSGVEAVILEGEELEQRLWNHESRKGLFDDIYSKVSSSPVWMQDQENGNYSVALKTIESTIAEQTNTNITYFRFPQQSNETRGDLDLTKLQVSNIPLKYYNPHRIVHLKDFPRFDEETGQWVK